MNFQKNEMITVEIEDIGSDGEGIGKVEGYTLFVKDAIVGDTVEARIVKAKKNYAYARLEKVIVPSPFRVEPKCAFHKQCGGCQIQTLSYEKQLAFKQKKIRDSLVRIGGFAPEYVDAHMEPIVGMEEPFRYRNKAQYPVGTDKNGKAVSGFYAGRTHTIIANTDCCLGAEENEAVLRCILDYMNQNHVSAYDEVSGTGLVRHILIRKGFASGEIMVCLVLNKEMTDASVFRKIGKNRKNFGRSMENGQEAAFERSMEDGQKAAFERSMENGQENAFERLMENGQEAAFEWSMENGQKAAFEWSMESGQEALLHGQEELPVRGKQKGIFLPKQTGLLQKLAQIPGMTSVSVSINTEKTNVIMGTEIYTLWGKDVISDTIRVRDMRLPGYPFTGKELTFHISPLSFYQVNPRQTEKLYSLALEYAGLTGKETVWDLYCGIGTISLFLAGNARKVYGVEIVPQAIADARQNASRNGIENAEFFVGKAEEVLQEFYEGNTEELRPDVIVVDPPRKGCDEKCLKAMAAVQPERIVYVSCDPATLARDLKFLCQEGYSVERIRGTDMFGMTVHVETVCLLSKLNVGHPIEVELNLDEMCGE